MIMKIYRYKRVKSTKQLDETKLNEFGRRGYELCGITDGEYGYTYYFKIEQKDNE